MGDGEREFIDGSPLGKRITYVVFTSEGQPLAQKCLFPKISCFRTNVPVFGFQKVVTHKISENIKQRYISNHRESPKA